MYELTVDVKKLSDYFIIKIPNYSLSFEIKQFFKAFFFQQMWLSSVSSNK